MTETTFHRLVLDIADRHRHVSELQFIRDNPEDFNVQLLSGGSINYIILVTSSADPNQKLILKHATNRIKSFPDAQLTSERIHSEFRMSSMWCNFRPGAFPKMILLDEISNTVVMEYVENAVTLSHMLNDGEADLDIARSIGEVLADLHKNTWFPELSKEQQAQHLLQFNINSMAEAKQDFEFDVCLDKDSPYNKIHDENLAAFEELVKDCSSRAELERLCQYVKTERQCVIHGDSHTSSILVVGKNIKVIDTEFTCVSIAGKDVALMITFYIMLSYRAKSEGNNQISTMLLKCVEVLLETYMSGMTPVLTTQHSRMNVMEDIKQFTGFFLFRFSNFADLHLHLALPAHVQPICWRSSKAILEAGRMETVSQLILLISEAGSGAE